MKSFKLAILAMMCITFIGGYMLWRSSAEVRIEQTAIGDEQAKMTRYQFALLMQEQFEIEAPSVHSPIFSDIPADDPAAQIIHYLAKERIFQGYPDNTYKPQRPVTKYFFAMIIVKLAKAMNIDLSSHQNSTLKFDDVPDNHWASREVKELSAAGIFDGETEFDGRAEATIGWARRALSRLANLRQQ